MNHGIEQEEKLTPSRTAGARRSRAERARAEIERRNNRSLSRTRSSNNSGARSSSRQQQQQQQQQQSTRTSSSSSTSGSSSNAQHHYSAVNTSVASANSSVASTTSANRNQSPMRSKYEKYEQKKLLSKTRGNASNISPTRRMRMDNSYNNHHNHNNNNNNDQVQGQTHAHGHGHAYTHAGGGSSKRKAAAAASSSASGMNSSSSTKTHQPSSSQEEIHKREQQPKQQMNQTQTQRRHHYEDPRKVSNQQRHERHETTRGGNAGAGIGADSTTQQQQQATTNYQQHRMHRTTTTTHKTQSQSQQQHHRPNVQTSGPAVSTSTTSSNPNPNATTTAVNPPPPPAKNSRVTSPSNATIGETATILSNATNTSSVIKPGALSVESPLPPLVQRALGDRSYDKRKNAALEVEALVKSLAEVATSNSTSNFVNTEEHRMVCSVIHLLSTEFTGSMNAHFRKGGLIGLAATAIGLMPQNLLPTYLGDLINPVLQGFDDTESRVRYYACESMYNIVKVARKSVLPFFNPIFNGLAKLSADLDEEVRDGSNLLDRLVKDIVTECEEFSVDEFLPLMQNYIRRTNPYIRQLLVGWITVLDSIPDVSMIDYLPYFLDGLFNMLSDSNLEIRQAADSALSEFLREVRESAVVEFDPMISILVFQCTNSKERLNRLTGITWLLEFIHHPQSGGDALLPFHSEVLGAILTCISDGQIEIRKVAERSNNDLLALVRDTKRDFELGVLIDCLTKELTGKDDVLTKMAVLKWINMLLEKRRRDMDEFVNPLMPALLKLLSDQSDSVVLLTVQVLSRISFSEAALKGRMSSPSYNKDKLRRDEGQFEMVIRSILTLFMADRRLLETRGSIIVRRLCVLLNAKTVYLIMADIISSYDVSPDESGNSYTLEFVATMVQTLNLILLTASELNNLRQLLEDSFSEDHPIDDEVRTSPNRSSRLHATNEGARVFAALFHCWSNNPVSTFSLCLLARAYDLAFALVKKFSELEVTVGFLMQVDKLIHLIESPIFVHLRLRLLDVEAPYHTYLLKSCYGLLMLLPQSDAYRSLNDRLTSVCNLRDNLGIQPSISASPSTGAIRTEEASIYQAGLDVTDLLRRFDDVMAMHSKARAAIQQKSVVVHPEHMNDRNVLVNNMRGHGTQRMDQKGMGAQVARQRG